MLMWQSPVYGQADCTLWCYEVNVSLGDSCKAEVTTDLVSDLSDCPNGQFQVFVYTLAGDTLPTSPFVTHDQIGMKLIASVYDYISGNSCWNYIHVEDKMKPTLECTDMTLSCLDLLNYDGPTAYDNCDPNPTVRQTMPEQSMALCEPPYKYVKKITRTYVAKDASGNESLPCTQTFYLERIDYSQIDWPDSLVTINGTQLQCNGGWADADQDGIPDPMDDGIHPGTGVPKIDGTPIYPDFIGSCNALTTYEDVVFPMVQCITKIMRVWTVREWHCSGETDTLYVQIIEIKDDYGPDLVCPADFSHTTTGQFCTANIWMPSAVAHDNCGDVPKWTVTYPGGYKYQNGQFWATLPVGNNIITYTAYDECDNSSSCTMTIAVQDNTPPVVVCDEHTIVSLTVGGPHGLTLVDASVFDDGSYDACGPVTFKARRMDSCIDFDWTTQGAGIDEIPNTLIDGRDWGTVHRPKVPFACCDAGAGPIMVELEVMDASGNLNYCMVEVNVQDKIKPIIHCPSDITISCEYPLDPEQLGAFGDVVGDQHDVQTWCIHDPGNPYDLDGDGWVCGTDGIYLDNCGVDISVTKDVHINSCGVGYIDRQWKASDSNGFDVCTQRITVKNFHPMSYGSIDWPDDYHGAECSEGTEPGDLPYQYSEPHFYDDECTMMAVGHEDLLFETVPGACFKILRTWKVMDWCMYEQYGQLVDGINYWEHTQVIKVINGVGPEFETLQPTIDSCSKTECNHVTLDLFQRVHDDCTPGNLIQATYAIDLNNDLHIDYGPYTDIDSIIQFSYDFKLGTHRIIYSFEDRCGNRTVREQFVNLTSCTAPIPVCVAMSTELDELGMVTIWASDFDPGHSSYHPCGIAFEYSFDPANLQHSRIFTCEDIGQDLPINIYVTDGFGNQQYCQTHITVTDADGVCAQGGTLTGTITGNISTETTENILDVEVAIAGSSFLPINTNHSGMYTFPAMPLGGNYVIDPGKNNDYKNGVSTLDLVEIQKHLLGIRDLSSPYKMIAADANNSKSITAYDLVELRKLILGIYSELPNNASWRFVDKTYSFPDPYNPWMQDWPENHILSPLSQGMNHADFYGIKVGDVNNTVKANASTILPRGSGQVLDLVIDDKVVSAGETFEMPVYASSANTLEGIQFSFDLGQVLNLVTVKAGSMDVTEENFGWLQNRTLTSSWNKADGLNVDETQPLFTLVLKADASVKLSEIISLKSNPTAAEAYTGNSDIMDLALSFRGSEGSFDFELLQNEPNPFTNTTQIGYIIPEGGEVILTMFDLTGKQLFNQTIKGVKGLNKVEVSTDQIASRGLIYYQVQFQGYTATKKMLIL